MRSRRAFRDRLKLLEAVSSTYKNFRPASIAFDQLKAVSHLGRNCLGCRARWGERRMASTTGAQWMD
eukprot:15436940-Alexandrium_andersonii.AAC.1